MASSRSWTLVDQDLARAAYALHVSVEACLQEVLTELDLTIPLADALWHLDPPDRALSRRALAERLRCDPSNVTFLADRLAQRGLISRVREAHDRRVSAVALTPTGVRTRDRLVAAVARSSMWGDLTSAERRQLAALLSRCGGFGGPDGPPARLP